MIDKSPVRLTELTNLGGECERTDVPNLVQASLRCVLKSEVVTFQPYSLRPAFGVFTVCNEAGF